MKIKALIPVRSGSVRVKNKNIAPFAGSSLLEIKIRQMLRIPELDGVVVNSNSEEMLQMAHRLGAETAKRDEYYATSSVSINKVYENMAQNMEADVIVFANCTSPLIEDRTYSLAIQKFLTLREHDSLVSVSPLKEFLWIDGKAANYDRDHKPRSQDLPDNFVLLNHVVHILPRETMMQCKDIIGEKPYFFPISQIESMDIDTPTDFAIAEYMYNKLIINNKRGGVSNSSYFSSSSVSDLAA